MSLYDIMNVRSRDKERRPIGMADEQSYPVTSAPASGMQSTRVNATPEVQVSQPVETPVVAEEKAPVTPVQRRGPVQAEPQAVQSTETPQKKPYTWWWQTPDFVGAVESQVKAAEKRAEQDRKRARRERNAAILGDLAKLGAQMYAKNGGAWKIDPFTPATEKTNDKLAALRARHAAEVAAFARQRAAAKQAQIADNNARMKLETSLAEADLDRKIKAEKDARDFAYKVTKDEFDAKIAAQNAEIAAQNAESRRISANASAGRASAAKGGTNNSSKTRYRVGGVDYDDPIMAYGALINNNPGYAITVAGDLYTKNKIGDPVFKIDEEGNKVTKKVEKENINKDDALLAIGRAIKNGDLELIREEDSTSPQAAPTDFSQYKRTGTDFSQYKRNK